MHRLITMLPSDFDDDGFLRNTDSWNEIIAEQVAYLNGITSLTEQQWSFISELRKYYLANHTPPPPRRICHISHLGNNCVSALFENHGIEAWKIAGLPNPGEEVKSYM